MHEPKHTLFPTLPRLAGEGDGRMNAIVVEAADVLGLFDDQVGVCLNCGTLSDPVPNEATSLHCEACGEPCMAGMNHALRTGAFRIDSAFAD